MRKVLSLLDLLEFVKLEYPGYWAIKILNKNQQIPECSRFLPFNSRETLIVH